MFLINEIQQIIEAGTQQLVTWFTGILPQVFLFLIFMNAATRLIGRSRVERLAARCSSHALLRYLVLPFLSAVVLGNPVAISMGRYLPERYKPAYFASASYHCHTNSGVFQHINPAELFIWIGIANGVMSLGLDPFPLTLRYLLAGLAANLISGYATELITAYLEKREGIRLETGVDLRSKDVSDVRKTAAPGSCAPVHGSEAASVSGTPEAGPGALPSAGSFLSAGAPAAPGSPAFSGDAPFRAITIVCGDGGYGGPVTVTPTEARHTVLYMTAGGLEPEPLDRILALSGMTAVNGNEETVPDEEVALAIIDCGGTLRCGIYPGKGIPTVNLLATGRSGPLAKYMTEDLYVSAVTSAQVSAAALDPAAAPDSAAALDPAADPDPAAAPKPGADPGPAADLDPAADRSLLDLTLMSPLLRPASEINKFISVFHQASRDAVRTCLDLLIPFMGFAALFIGICRGSGLTAFLASLLRPMGSSLPGFLGLGVICSLPGLSAILGAGAVAAQMFSTVIGDLIASGSIPPAMALPALFAINCQCACDFIPVGLGMTEAKPQTVRMGIPAVTLSRFLTGWIRILIALLFSIGLYR